MHPAQGVRGYAESPAMQRAAQLSGMLALWILGLLGLGVLCPARFNFPSSAMAYQRSADGHQFSLTVAADRIEQYDSNTRTWTQSY